MSRNSSKLRVGLAAVIVTLLAGVGSIQAAEQKSANEILNALKPKGLTRSLSAGATPAPQQQALSAEDQRFINSLRSKRTRSLTVSERDRVASIAKEKPSIDLEINFDYDSSEISRKAMPGVTELGKALSSPDLKGSVFLVAGHTDGKGGDEYNQGLSERRAEAIKRYLVQKFGLAAENLVTAGYGKTQLKNSGDPFADENRRVQVVNMEAKEARN